MGTSGGSSGGSTAGAATVRKFAFAYNTANILTGATMYTPTVGDILLDAWISVLTIWDGVTPKADIGQFNSGIDGLFSDCTTPVSMIQADQAAAGSSGILFNSLEGSLAAVNVLGNAGRLVPAKFTSTAPIKVCVSQDGTNTGLSPASTQGAAILYLVTSTPT